MSESYIRRIAREEVNSKFLERDFLNLLFSGDMRDKINSQIGKYVRSDKFRERINYQIDERLNIKLPQLIQPQLDAILKNNLLRMENIYNEKENSLKIKLSQSATNIIEKVVSDPNYTSIVDPHIKAIQNKGNNAIKHFENDGALALNKLRRESNLIKDDIDKRMQKLENTNKPLQVIGGMVVKTTAIVTTGIVILGLISASR